MWIKHPFSLNRIQAILNIVILLVGLRYVQANPVLTPGSWVNITPPGIAIGSPNSMLGQGVTVDPNNPSILWWGNTTYLPSTTNPVTALPDTGLYKSTDGGSTWAQIPPFDEPLHIRIEPGNSKHVYVVDGVRGNYNGFWVSTNGGASWTQPPGFLTMCAAVQAAGHGSIVDGYSIAVDPTDFKHVLYTAHSCSDGIVSESFDGGNTWTYHVVPCTSCSGGYAVFFLYNPATGVGNAQTWLYGTQGDGYWRTSDSGNTWMRVTPGFPENMTHGGNQLYYAKNGWLYSGSTIYPMRSSDNGITWTQLSANGLPYSYYFAIMGDGKNLYTGTAYDSSSIYVSSETDGLTWKPFSSGQSLYGPFEMSFDSQNGIMYFSSESGGVWALGGLTQTRSMVTNCLATPAGVTNNVNHVVIFSLKAKATNSTITNVSLNLSALSGPASVKMTNISGSTLWRYAYTVPAGLAVGAATVQISAQNNTGLKDANPFMAVQILQFVSGIVVTNLFATRG